MPRSLLAWLLCVVLLTIAAFVGIAVPGVPVAVALLAVPALLARYALPSDDRPWVLAVAFAGMAVRVVFGIALMTFLRDQVFDVFNDTIRYVDIGAQMAQAWHQGG